MIFSLAGRHAFVDESVLFATSSQQQVIACARQERRVSGFACFARAVLGVGLSGVIANRLTGPLQRGQGRNLVYGSRENRN